MEFGGVYIYKFFFFSEFLPTNPPHGTHFTLIFRNRVVHVGGGGRAEKVPRYPMHLLVRNFSVVWLQLL